MAAANPSQTGDSHPFNAQQFLFGRGKPADISAKSGIVIKWCHAAFTLHQPGGSLLSQIDPRLVNVIFEALINKVVQCAQISFHILQGASVWT